MKVVNVSEKPFEFTFDSCNYGPIPPGGVMDMPAEMVQHAIRHSALRDEEGYIVGYKLEPLDALDKERRAAVSIYQCPLVPIDECRAGNFRTVEELMAHIRTHQEPKKAVRAVPAEM